MKPIYILDTNVLLHNPQIFQDFPDAEVILPETVLLEIDKLKTARADKETRYKGRKISRLLFKLTQKGSLTQGVPLKDNSLLRVVKPDFTQKIPEALKTRRSDDRILAVAYQLAQAHPDRKTTLITNDLNMLVKAQMFNIKTECLEERLGAKDKFRYLLAKVQKRFFIWFVVATLVVLIILAGFTLWSLRTQPQTSIEVLSQLETERSYQAQEDQYLQIIKEDPQNLEALVSLGNLYYKIQDWQSATQMYQKALKINPLDTDIRTNMATAYYYLGESNKATRQLHEVLASDPNHAEAHYALGMILWKNKSDYRLALREFENYLQLAPSGIKARAARENIEQLKKLIREEAP